MYSFLKRLTKKSSQRRVGVDFCAEGITLAISDQRGNNTAMDCHFIPVADHSRFLAELKSSVQKYGLKDTPAFVVMPHDSYSLLQLSSPPMDKAELCASAKWRIREMVSYPVDEAVVDVFEFPESGQKGNERIHYVVAARSKDVKNRIEMIRQSGLDLQVLDISELTIRNVISMLKSNAEGAVIISFSSRSGLMAMIKNDEMYLARHLEVGLEDLVEDDPVVGLSLTPAAESVALELQRSMDYFESKFMQAPLKKVFVYPPCQAVEMLIVKIRETVAMEISVLDLTREIENISFSFGNHEEQNSLLAIGAAMRRQVEARLCSK